MMNKGSMVMVMVIGVMCMVGGVRGQRGAMLGNYRPIRDLNEPYVQEIARFAVSKHNQLDGTNLVYVRILKGDAQVVAGTNYRLQISAKDSSSLRDYLALVYDRPWDNFRNLSSFLPL
ncbi:hypothetical protein vseg_011218 [Gypsophila vaccaria]